MEKPCKNNTYCENNVGSYLCKECDFHCDGCTDKGEQNCIECKTGFVRNAESNYCNVDVDECKETPDICPKKMLCRNNVGGYDCMGKKNYLWMFVLKMLYSFFNLLWSDFES